MRRRACPRAHYRDRNVVAFNPRCESCACCSAQRPRSSDASRRHARSSSSPAWPRSLSLRFLAAPALTGRRDRIRAPVAAIAGRIPRRGCEAPQMTIRHAPSAPV